MAAQRALYYVRVARNMVHAVQAQHFDALRIAKRESITSGLPANDQQTLGDIALLIWPFTYAAASRGVSLS